MKYLRQTIWTMIATALMCLAAAGAQAQGKLDTSLKDVVTKELNQKTKLVGTFDLYDEKSKQVRNLRMMSIGSPVEDEDGLRVPVQFRDAATGDMVTVDAQIQKSGSSFKVGEWLITKVEAAPQVETKESYTDAEVKQAIDDYFTQQTKFTDHLLFFDPKIENMRKLELLNFKNNYRHFGILTIETAEFTDLETGEMLTMDIHVKVKKGLLEVEQLKIKKVTKPKTAGAKPAPAPDAKATPEAKEAPEGKEAPEVKDTPETKKVP